MPEYVAALDQGTTSTRCIVFAHDGREVGRHQLTHHQHFPRPGWVEHDPVEILENARAVVDAALATAGLTAGDLAAVGVTNQRETAVIWDRRSGRPLHRAIVWQDTRTAPLVRTLEENGETRKISERTGLIPATYFSATKLAWLLDNVEGARAGAERGDVLFGTVDSWLTWNLTRGALHVTDVTNASRTMLMDLVDLEWSDEMLALFNLPAAMLPEIRPSSGPLGLLQLGSGTRKAGVPLSGVLGDQQAAMVGHGCFAPGDAKCTYGTGSFLLANTGAQVVRSRAGLLSTVCYQRVGERAHYALEGAIAVSGAAIAWLRDQLGVIASAAETEQLAASVADTGDLYFVPAFSGLFAPYWRSDARGIIVGLTAAHTRAHLVRATLEAICFQTSDLFEAVGEELGYRIGELRVDGGVTDNDLCMQMQADILGLRVRRAATAEVTALGAARAAALGAGFWSDDDLPPADGDHGRDFVPSWGEERRAHARGRWHLAVERTLGWADGNEEP